MAKILSNNQPTILKRILESTVDKIHMYFFRKKIFEYVFSERVDNVEEWSWYEKYIVNYYLHDLKLAGRFTPSQIHRAIGLINVNAVALKFPMNASSES